MSAPLFVGWVFHSLGFVAFSGSEEIVVARGRLRASTGNLWDPWLRVFLPASEWQIGMDTGYQKRLRSCWAELKGIAPRIKRKRPKRGGGVVGGGALASSFR